MYIHVHYTLTLQIFEELAFFTIFTNRNSSGNLAYCSGREGGGLMVLYGTYIVYSYMYIKVRYTIKF